MSISAIVPFLPRLASPMQMVSNAQSITLVAICSLALLPTAFAGACHEAEKICVQACHTFNSGSETGACLIGCKLAYWACHYFMKGKG